MKNSIPQLRKELTAALAEIDRLNGEIEKLRAARNIVRVPVPVDVIKEKRVEVPVDRVVYVDKRVEVPVEVDRIVTREVEKPVTIVKRVEVPTERVVYVDNPALVEMVRKLQTRIRELTNGG